MEIHHNVLPSPDVIPLFNLERDVKTFLWVGGGILGELSATPGCPERFVVPLHRLWTDAEMLAALAAKGCSRAYLVECGDQRGAYGERGFHKQPV
jgi:hypothetical protein